MTEAMFVTDAEVEKALDFLASNAEKAAKARAERVYVEAFLRTIKSQLMQPHADKPIGAQEREAYAHKDYVKHLDAIKEAVARDEELRWRKEAAQATIEAWRTQSSNERAMKL